MKSHLEQLPEIRFRHVPDPSGDSCTFLSWFLPTEAAARAFVATMKEQGILAGNFYWFDNNWHYIRKWDHLKYAATLNNLHADQQQALANLADASFPQSDAIMNRCISTLINLNWTNEQIKEKGEKMAAVIKAVLEQEKHLA